MKDRINLLNTKVDNLSMAESINEIDRLIKLKKTSYVVTPNVDHIVQLEDDDEFREIYKNADLVLTDGMPLIWISWLLRRPIKEKVSGSDLFPNVCEMAAKNSYKLFILGAEKGVAKIASENLKKKYKGLNVVGTFSPKYGFEKDPNEVLNIINIVKKANPDILAIGLGTPKQEKFIYRYKDDLGVPVCLAIGASIDFIAGKVKRAPLWMQKIGFEWFYRLYKEPNRMFKRYIMKDLKIFKILIKYKNK